MIQLDWCQVNLLWPGIRPDSFPPPHSPAIELEMYHITIEGGWMEGRSTSWLANTFTWTTGSDPEWEMYIHNNYNKVKPNIHGSGVSSLCVPQGAGELPRRPAMSHGTEHQYFRITALWCVCVYAYSAALYPSCHLHSLSPTAVRRPAAAQYRAYMHVCVCPLSWRNTWKGLVSPCFVATALSGPKKDRSRGQRGHVSSFLSSPS